MAYGSDTSFQLNVLGSTPQAFTDAWVDIGDEIDTAGYNTGLLWINLDIGDSTDAEIRCLAKSTIDGGVLEFEYPIETISSTSVGLEGRKLQFTTDEDQKVIKQINLNGLIPIVQLQIKAAANQTTGTIDNLWIHLI